MWAARRCFSFVDAMLHSHSKVLAVDFNRYCTQVVVSRFVSTRTSPLCLLFFLSFFPVYKFLLIMLNKVRWQKNKKWFHGGEYITFFTKAQYQVYIFPRFFSFLLAMRRVCRALKRLLSQNSTKAVYIVKPESKDDS